VNTIPARLADLNYDRRGTSLAMKWQKKNASSKVSKVCIMQSSLKVASLLIHNITLCENLLTN
jgi:hypothetical protein